MKYTIGLHGNGDSTIFDMDLNKEEYALMKRFSEIAWNAHTHGITPTMTISRPDVGCTELLAESIAILRQCEETWGCECPYCDRDFGKEWDSHADDCRIKKFLITANAS